MLTYERQHHATAATGGHAGVPAGQRQVQPGCGRVDHNVLVAGDSCTGAASYDVPGC